MAFDVGAQLVQSASWRPQGYPRLANLMGRSQDAAIFRRFNDINMLSLLSLQAEIAALRDAFRNQCKADDISGYEKLSKNFLLLRNTEGEDQYTILVELRRKMKEYSKSE